MCNTSLLDQLKFQREGKDLVDFHAKVDKVLEVWNYLLFSYVITETCHFEYHFCDIIKKTKSIFCFFLKTALKDSLILF